MSRLMPAIRGRCQPRGLFLAVTACTTLAVCSRSDIGRVDSAARESSTVAESLGSGSARPDTGWTVITTGATAGDFTLSAAGTLSWRGRALTPPLPTRSAEDTSATISYHISPLSPASRWALAQGRGPTFALVYVLDLDHLTTRETPVTKYGIVSWVAWAPDLPYAVVSNRLEGTALLYRIDLATGAARQIDVGRSVQPPLSATPSESTLRWIDNGTAFSIEARVACNAAVERCDGAPPADMRRFRVDVRTLQVTDKQN